jgi:hypothetical protein
VGDAAPPRAGWRRSLTSATVGARAHWSGDREAGMAAFPPSMAGVRAGSREGSTTEGSKESSGTPTSTKKYDGGVINSRRDFLNLCSQGVRSNA